MTLIFLAMVVSFEDGLKLVKLRGEAMQVGINNDLFSLVN